MPAPKATDQLSATTPLGNALLLTGFHGSEGISRLFRFQLDLVAENQTEVPFDQLLGQAVTVHLGLPKGTQRHWNGIISRASQGERDEEFTSYRLEMVPRFWLWSRRVQSRIFQHKNIPDILKEALKGLDVKFEIQGTFHPRNYCTQYAESDFAFASRLMEEEGIYYYFKHADGAHQLVVANTPQSHLDVPEYPKAIFEAVKGGQRADDRLWTWAKSQEICSGKYTLWDHTFELPGKNLAAETTIADSVAVGKVTHKLKVAGNDQLETYVFPGGYAHRYDGIDRSGGERPAELEKIFEDNQRTCRLRMEEEAARSLKIEGSGSCGQFTAGHKFTLERHFNADGAYVLTAVEHDARIVGDLRKSHEQALEYQNAFTCLPAALPFRPPLATPKPLMQGTQTATVVGPPGPEEIFTDKYGRVKIQLHWDRGGQHDPNSSCWVRVGSSWAGKGWGFIQLPRIGQEVIVAFSQGNPDQPIIIGSVYNADQMPAVPLPAGRKICGLITKSNPHEGGHHITCDDTSGAELLTIHATKDMVTTIANNDTIEVGADRTETVKGSETVTIESSRSHYTTLNSLEHVFAAKELIIGGGYSVNVVLAMNEFVGVSKTEETGGFRAEVVGGYRTEQVIGYKASNIGYNYSLTVGKDFSEVVASDHAMTVGGKSTNGVKGDWSLTAKNITGTATGDQIVFSRGSASITMTDAQIELACGASKIVLHNDGLIQITGNSCDIETKNEVNLASNKITAEAKADLQLSGSTYTLDTSSGDGNVKAAAIIKIKSPQVQINC